jgi:hypothetical protein
MPYHVELRGPMQRACVFNLDDAELWAQVLAPWAAGERLELSGHTWEPGERALRIVEGPRLDAADLAYGRGWSRAEHSGRDVTSALLQAPATVVSPTRAGHELGVALLAEAGLGAVDWGPVREALLAGREPGVRAALVMVTAEPGSWLLDAGLALGALAGRAHVVAAEAAAPARLGGVEVLAPEAALRRLRGSG